VKSLLNIHKKPLRSRKSTKSEGKIIINKEFKAKMRKPKSTDKIKEKLTKGRVIT